MLSSTLQPMTCDRNTRLPLIMPRLTCPIPWLTCRACCGTWELPRLPSPIPSMLWRLAAPLSARPSMLWRLAAPFSARPSMLWRLAAPLSARPSILWRLAAPLCAQPSLLWHMTTFESTASDLTIGQLDTPCWHTLLAATSQPTTCDRNTSLPLILLRLTCPPPPCRVSITTFVPLTSP